MIIIIIMIIWTYDNYNDNDMTRAVNTAPFICISLNLYRKKGDFSGPNTRRSNMHE